MARISALKPEELTPDQKRIATEITAGRAPTATLRGPFAILLRTPEIADRVSNLGYALTSQKRLGRRLFELTVLVVASHWSAEHERAVHSERGLKAGLDPEILEAIRNRETPKFKREDERIVYDLVKEISETRKLSQPMYDRALEGLGLEQVIDVISVAGFYTMLAMLIISFDVEPPSS